MSSDPARPDLDVSIDLIFSISHQLDRGTPASSTSSSNQDPEVAKGI